MLRRKKAFDFEGQRPKLRLAALQQKRPNQT
jgi:hypothetical protein